MLGAVDLSPEELRVLGCLVEKQLTTPQQYPLTLNALMLACNQASNRDPVLFLDEPTVEAAVTSVKTRGLAGFVHPSHGCSALRFRHALDEALGLDARPLALLAVLMLRGPQTSGELRSRTERMVRFADLHEVEAELEALAGRADALVVRLARAPGQKEDRYAHLLGAPGAPGTAAPSPASATGPVRPGDPGAVPHYPGAVPTSRPVVGGGHPVPPGGPGVEDLRAEVDRLRAEVVALARDLADLRAQLGA
jgi:uncharacterized protein YceH (UPF0502 family)